MYCICWITEAETAEELLLARSLMGHHGIKLCQAKISAPRDCVCVLELATNLHENFTIIENAPTTDHN